MTIPAISYISRDPFARQDGIRQIVRELNGGCDNCGPLRDPGNLFRYGIEPDAIRTPQHWSKGKFCSKQCHNMYHG